MSWGVGRLTAALYPFGAGAMAVNVFFVSLIGNWAAGWPVLSTTRSIVVGAIIGIPATYLFARHIRGLMDEAEREP